MLTRRNPQRSLSSILGVGKIQTNSENNTKNLHPTENHPLPNELDISLSSSNQSENDSGDRYSPSISISSAKQLKAITFKKNSQINHSIPSNKSDRDDESAFSASSHSSSIHGKNDKVAKDIIVPTNKLPYKEVSKTRSPSLKDPKIEKKSSNLISERLLKKEKSREFSTLTDKEHDAKEHNVLPKLPIDKIESFDKEEFMPNTMKKSLDTMNSKVDLLGSEFRYLRSEIIDQLRHLNQKLDLLAANKAKEIHEVNNANSQNLELNHEGKVNHLGDSIYEIKNSRMTPEIKVQSNENPNMTNHNLIERMDKLERMFSAYCCNARKGSKKSKKSTSTDDTHTMGYYHSSRRARANEMFVRIPRDTDKNQQLIHHRSRGIGGEGGAYYNFTNLAPFGGSLRGPAAFDDISHRLKTFQNRFTQEAEHLGDILDRAIISTHPSTDLSSSGAPAQLAPHWKLIENNDRCMMPLKVPQLELGPGNNLQVSHTTLTNGC